MEENPLQSELRRLRREERLGEGAHCFSCPESDPRALEKHHFVGRAHDQKVVVIICRNCHAKRTADALDAGADMRNQPTLLQRIAMILRALGSLFEAMAEAVFRYADDLIQLVTALNNACPNWSTLREAK